MQRGEGAGRKPAALLLRLEVFQEVIDFFFADRFAQRHKEIRGDQVAVEFRNFVLEDPVVSKGVPRQLCNKTVILVQVLAVRCEDDIGNKFTAYLMHPLFDLSAVVWKKTIFKIFDDDARLVGSHQKRFCAASRLAPPLRRGAQHEPMNDDFGLVILNQFQNGSAAADLDIVGVRTQT